jgi:hypothetical protein
VRALEQPGPRDRVAHLGQVTADLHHHRGTGVPQSRFELLDVEHAGEDDERLVPRDEGRGDRRRAGQRG